MPDIHYRTCSLCEAMCGLAIEVEGPDILAIKGDRDDPFSRGHLCPKAIALKDIHQDPDRLRQPLKRTPDGWRSISWQQAFDETAERLQAVKASHGRDAIGVYLGNPNVHNHGTMLSMLPFLRALGSRKRFSATSLDQLPHMLAQLQMFGHQLLFPVPDLDRTELLICVGANPLASNGSLMTAPDVGKRLKAIAERGGRLITIDPRRTETAQVAQEHLFIRPGTDAYLFLGMLHCLFTEKRIHLGAATDLAEGLEVLAQVCQDWSAERVAPITGIDADRIRSLARELAQTPKAALYTRMGVSTQQFGSVATWLAYCLNIVTGHLDQPGGMMFTSPAVDGIGFGTLAGQTGHFGKFRSRVRGLPEFGGELPTAALAEEILTPGEGQIRALVTSAGNPVLSSPNGRQLEQALESLDFMVCIDFYLNETTRHAHIILPPTGPLEHSHYDLVFHLLAIRNTAKYSPALFEPAPDSRHDWQIFNELTRRLSGRDLPSRLVAQASYRVMNRFGADGLIDLLLRLGPYGTRLSPLPALQDQAVKLAGRVLPARHPLRRLLELGPYGEQAEPRGLSLEVLRHAPHGIDLGPLRPRLPSRLFTRNGKIHLAPVVYLGQLDRLTAWAEGFQEDSLLLIGRRHLRSNNSWMHNSHRLVKGPNRCTLMIHPQDAARLGLMDGSLAQVQSRVGQIEIEVEFSDDLMPGVVSIPHGWGHHRPGTQLGVAQQHAGVSLNDITDDQFLDRLSGNAAFNGVAVEVSAVAAGQTEPAVQNAATSG